jgi:hypothetical protein
MISLYALLLAHTNDCTPTGTLVEIGRRPDRPSATRPSSQ